MTYRQDNSSSAYAEIELDMQEAIGRRLRAAELFGSSDWESEDDEWDDADD